MIFLLHTKIGDLTEWALQHVKNGENEKESGQARERSTLREPTVVK